MRILDEIWQSLLDKPRDLVEGFIPVFDNLIKEGYPEYEFDQNEIESFINERVKELISPPGVGPDIKGSVGAKPRNMKIGNDSYEIEKSYEILVNTAEWLIGKGKLKKEDCPIISGYKWNLVNTRSEHRYPDDSGDKTFKARKKLSNGLYIETKYSTQNCIKNARKLLGIYGYPRDMLEVQ